MSSMSRRPPSSVGCESHTASVAGDYAVTRRLAEAAGIVLADTLTRGDRDEVITLLAWHAERVQESVYRLGGSPSGQTAVPRR